MPRPLELLLASAPLIGCLLMGCLREGGGPDTLAGTSTSIGTSVGGTALLGDGSPAAGARVRLRADTIAFRDGIPESRTLDSAIADARGGFALHVPKRGSYHLDIECGAAQACGSGALRVFQEIYYGNPEGNAFDALRLLEPGSITGEVIDSAAGTDLPLWIGIRGTGRFVKAGEPDTRFDPPRRAFRLDGVSPGERILEMARDGGTPGIDPSRKVHPLPVSSGGVTDAGLIVY
jgi:hypothetical protein